VDGQGDDKTLSLTALGCATRGPAVDRTAGGDRRPADAPAMKFIDGSSIGTKPVICQQLPEVPEVIMLDRCVVDAAACY
jgi:hypothetical protein